ncbi:MAG: MFS transporter [Erysipelotrichaceae bacterium]|nr:MFS transporter [Erysipelotrichaceae bacterium]
MKSRYLVIIAALCGLIASGVGLITNIAGLFFTPIATELELLRGSVSMNVTIGNLFFAAGGIMSPRVMKEKNMKLMLIVMTALIAGSTALLAAANNVYLMYVLNGIRGFASGIVGFVFVTIVINHWFFENNGLVTSVAMGFSGLAGAVFSPLMSSIISASGWRTAYIVSAVLMVILNLPAILFLPSIDPYTKGLKPYGEKKAASVSDTVSEPSVVKPALVALLSVYAVCAAASTSLTQHFPGVAASRGLDAAVGATMLSVCMLANTGGKILLGALVDRFGARVSLSAYAVLIASAVLMMLFVPSGAVMYVSAGLFGLAYAMATVGTVTLSKEVFGLANYGKTYPKINMCGTMASAAFSSIIGFMYDASGNYNMTLYTVLAMMITAFVIITYVYRNVVSKA